MDDNAFYVVNSKPAPAKDVPVEPPNANRHQHRAFCSEVPREVRETSEFQEMVGALRCTSFRRDLSPAARKRLRRSRRP